jgi:ferrous iron transport protein A
MQIMKMVNMAMGTIGRIASAESVSIELQSKLYALGIFPGVEIKVLRQAPLGDPLQVRVGPSLLSIRKRDAAFIDVDMVS